MHSFYYFLTAAQLEISRKLVTISGKKYRFDREPLKNHFTNAHIRHLYVDERRGDLESVEKQNTVRNTNLPVWPRDSN